VDLANQKGETEEGWIHLAKVKMRKALKITIGIRKGSETSWEAQNLRGGTGKT